jgi:hypothetical protein
MSEVRPWLAARISLGRFVTTRELKIVDLSIGHDSKPHPDLLLGSPSSSEILEGVWNQVDRAFSTPVTDDVDTAEYIPTQIIAETFRRKGLDGLVYKSQTNAGMNFALFDLGCVDLKTRDLFETIRRCRVSRPVFHGHVVNCASASRTGSD